MVHSTTCPVRLRTINERVSEVVFISKTRDRTAKESNRISKEQFKKISLAYRKTLTRDRGSENIGYKVIEDTLGMKCYFAHAYSSWEQGANENVNGLISDSFQREPILNIYQIWR